MYTLLFCLVTLSFFMLYNSSQKVKFTKHCLFTTWIRNNRMTAKSIAYALLLSSLLLQILVNGIGVGLINYVMFLMLTASLTVATYPTISMKYTHVLSLVGVSLLFEYILF